MDTLETGLQILFPFLYTVMDQKVTFQDATYLTSNTLMSVWINNKTMLQCSVQKVSVNYQGRRLGGGGGGGF